MSEDVQEFLASFLADVPTKPRKRAFRPTQTKANLTSSDNFSVLVRVRPGQARGIANNGSKEEGPGEEADGVGLDEERKLVWTTQGNNKYRFHRVLGPASSTTAAYEGPVREAVLSAVEGYNATVFAYGMTGSGKTHTMVGPDSGRGGLDGIIPCAARDVFEAGHCAVAVSFLQIYQGIVTDLLASDGTGKAKALPVRDAPGMQGAYAEGLLEVDVESVDDVLVLLRRGLGVRATAATQCNALSSRSHAVLSLLLSRKPDMGAQEQPQWTNSRLNLVDLAGSERVKVSGVEGKRLDEAVWINSSLLSLSNVIKALTEDGGQARKHIPYRDSKLTRLLANSFGGNCQTVLLATVSPVLSASAETESTLRFACRATYVKNDAIVSGGPKASKEASSLARKKIRERKAQGMQARMAAQRAVTVPSAVFFNGWVDIPLKRGRQTDAEPSHVAAQAFGRSADPLMVLLHGFPSCSDNWTEMFAPLVEAKWRVLAIDMPGFGRSAGDRLPSRSESNLDPGGPVDIVIDALDYFGVVSCAVFGYDWGGGIALSLALEHAKRLSHVVVYHSSFQKEPKLSKLRQPSLVLWSKADQFHPFKWATALSKTIPTAQLVTVRSHAAATRALVTWLAANRPKLKLKKKPKGTTTASPSKKIHQPGTATTGVGRRVGDKGAKSSARSKGEEKTNREKEAVLEFIALRKAGKLPELYGAMLGMGSFSKFKPKAVSLFSRLPELSPDSLSHPDDLVRLGLWNKCPDDWDNMQASPRYFPSSPCLALATVVGHTGRPDSFLRAERGGEAKEGNVDEAMRRGDEYVTPHATVAKVVRTASGDIEAFHVNVACVGGGSRIVPMAPAAFLDLNQRHRFRGSGVELGASLFEDGQRMSWSSLLGRARLCAIALAVCPIVDKLDFSADVDECLALQRQSVECVRRELNITCLYDGVDRRREARSQDIARLMTYGQGHCHGLSSVMAAALVPFAPLLGLDVRYRCGDHFTCGAMVSRVVDRHHWLEFSCRPSMRMFVCDVTFQTQGKRRFEGVSELFVPVQLAYSIPGWVYPHGTIPRFALSSPMLSGDVAG